jgi:hypothetical protein
VSFIRFVRKIQTEYPKLYNKGNFIVKLPFASGGVVRDKCSIKYPVGVEGIFKSIDEFMRNHPACHGYIHYIIIQPRFANNSEAKVILFFNNIFI